MKSCNRWLIHGTLVGLFATAACATSDVLPPPDSVGFADDGGTEGGNGGQGGSETGQGGAAVGGATTGNSGGSVNTGGSNVGIGGAPNTGGTVSASGGSLNTGGSPVATGGSPAATGGVRTQGTGGSPLGTGGASPSTGGMLTIATGGAAAGTGGTPAATGGKAAGTGGTPVATGGSPTATGGSPPATGGAPVATGGSPPATGGSPAATGGGPPTGGAPATGGTSSVPPASGLEVNVVGATDVAGGSSLKLYIQIINTASSTQDMSSVTLRYWYQDDGWGSTALQMSADYVSVGYSNTGTATLDGAFAATTPVAGADHYIQLSFTGTLAATGDSKSNNIFNVHVQLHTAGYSGTEDVANDYSYTGVTGTDSKITLYSGGTLISGTEP